MKTVIEQLFIISSGMLRCNVGTHDLLRWHTSLVLLECIEIETKYLISFYYCNNKLLRSNGDEKNNAFSPWISL